MKSIFFNQRRLFMKTKTKGFLLTASVCLAMAFTFSCSSDDWLGDPSSSSNGGGEPSSSSNGGGDPSSSSNGGGGYLPCSEAIPLFEVAEGVEHACRRTCEEEGYECVLSCMEKDDIVKHICGGNSIEACNEHYNAECSNGGGDGNSITYEGETYPTVVIGTQTWLAKNLNYAAAGSKCYDDDPAYCQEYGRLYDWETALGVCPSGWHLPSNDDWDELFLYVDSQNDGNGSNEIPYDSYTAGRYLKATSGWNWDDYEDISGNGTDKYGFSAMPGGIGELDGSFLNVGDFGYWWSASENVSYSAYFRRMRYDSEYALWDSYSKTYLSSVRCVKD